LRLSRLFFHKRVSGFFAYLAFLHSHPDKVAKFMRKENAQMSNSKVIALTNQKGGVGYGK